MREEIPRVAVLAVVLAHRAPRPFRHIRPPPLPCRVGDPAPLCIVHRAAVSRFIPGNSRCGNRVTPPCHSEGMRTAEVQTLVSRVADVASDCADCVVLKAGVADLRRLKSWVEGREVEFAQRIAAVSSFPEKSLAEAANTSVRDGGRLLQRAETAAAVPEFGVSLNDGRVSGGHLDVLGRVMRSVTPAVADQLGADGERLVRLAQHSTPDEFARTVREAARVLEADRDGLDRLGASAASGAVRVVGRQGHRYGTHFTDPRPARLRQSRTSPRRSDRGSISRCAPGGVSDGSVGETISSCALTPCCRCSTAKGRGPVVRRSSSSKITPTRSPMGDRHSIGVPTSTSPTRYSNVATDRQRVCDHRPQRGDHRRTRSPRSGSRDAVGEPGSTTSLQGSVRDVCGAGLLCALLTDQVASHHLVATRWTHRHGESDSVVRDPPPEESTTTAGPSRWVRTANSRSPCRTDKS